MKITNEMFDSYIKCEYKAYLKGRLRIGIKSEFETFSECVTSERRALYFAALSARYNAKCFPDNFTLTSRILKIGYDYLCNVFIENKELISNVITLEKTPEPSSLGDFSYIPK